MASSVGENRGDHIRIPCVGDRIEVVRAGIASRGQVHYADHLQVLVKFDDGRSASLRIGRDHLRILDA
jgi:hypothetical protein